jgi:hypothetical protein
MQVPYRDLPGATPAMLSPCAHTPACPQPGPCLPTTMLASAPASPAPPGGPPLPGYEVAAGYITKFAGNVDGSATAVDRLKAGSPRFEGWNLAPLAGVPLLGLFFVQRCNAISDEWANSAGILRDLLRTDSARLNRAAANYIAAEKASIAGNPTP